MLLGPFITITITINRGPSLSSPSQNDRVHRALFATCILFSKILILYIYIYKYIILDFIFIVSPGGEIGFKNNCDSVIVMRSAGCVRRVIVMGDFVKKVVQGVQVEYIIWRRQADKEVSHRSSGCRFQRADAGSKQADGSPGVPSLSLRSDFAFSAFRFRLLRERSSVGWRLHRSMTAV